VIKTEAADTWENFSQTNATKSHKEAVYIMHHKWPVNDWTSWPG